MTCFRSFNEPTNYVTQAANQVNESGSILQLHGDIIQQLARTVGLAREHQVGLATLLTDQSVQLWMEKWAMETEETFGPAPDYRPDPPFRDLHRRLHGGGNNAGYEADTSSDDDDQHRRRRRRLCQGEEMVRSGRRLLEKNFQAIRHAFVLKDDMAWFWTDLGNPATGEGRRNHMLADAVLLQTMAFYWHTYMCFDRDINPTTNSQADKPWKPYDLTATFEHSMNAIQVTGRKRPGRTSRPLGTAVGQLIMETFDL